MESSEKYIIKTDIKFNALEKIDISKIVSACKYDWFNQTLCRVNDSVVRLGVLKGEFHWHKHDNEDEFFFVNEGSLIIDFEDKTVELEKNQGVVVPRGVLHRPRSPERSVVLMIETATVLPTGDA